MPLNLLYIFFSFIRIEWDTQSIRMEGLLHAHMLTCMHGLWQDKHFMVRSVQDDTVHYLKCTEWKLARVYKGIVHTRVPPYQVKYQVKTPLPPPPPRGSSSWL
jgi:hypothetical protein